jgi:hypothetical protein
LGIRFSQDDSRIELGVRQGAEPVLDLVVFAHDFKDVVNPYHPFTVDDYSATPYKVNIFMEAPHSEHEDERGKLTPYRHLILQGLAIADVDPVPFREEWYRAGVQTFDGLERR